MLSKIGRVASRKPVPDRVHLAQPHYSRRYIGTSNLESNFKLMGTRIELVNDTKFLNKGITTYRYTTLIYS